MRAFAEVSLSAVTRRELLASAVLGVAALGCSDAPPVSEKPVPPPPDMSDMRGGSVEATTPEESE